MRNRWTIQPSKNIPHIPDARLLSQYSFPGNDYGNFSHWSSVDCPLQLGQWLVSLHNGCAGMTTLSSAIGLVPCLPSSASCRLKLRSVKEEPISILQKQPPLPSYDHRRTSSSRSCADSTETQSPQVSGVQLWDSQSDQMLIRAWVAASTGGQISVIRLAIPVDKDLVFQSIDTQGRSKLFTLPRLE